MNINPVANDMLDKQIERLKDLQQELFAMKQLGAEDHIIKAQILKIKRQENKIVEMQKGGK